MQWMRIACVLGAAVLLTACTATPAPSPNPTTSEVRLVEEDGCPSGTSPQEDLCLSGDPVSEELAGILR
ncbi:MAG TPA: hypothetical protein VNP97_02705, partial [Microbacterium sp.]|nr:hypothetical protein [Microbacterium sp.]